MILPSDEECRRVLDELADEPNLTEWEATFIESNTGRQRFSDRQKETIHELIEKYDV